MHSTKIRSEKLTIGGPRKPAATTDRPDQMLDTAKLFKGSRELKIRHNSEVYRLTITKLGKLILTK